MEETTKLVDFCRSALTLLGLDVTEEASGVVHASIPSSRLDLFDGRTELRLAFDPSLADDDVELVVPGSYALEKLLEIVRQRGSLTNYNLTPAVQNPPPPRVNMGNAEIRLVSSQTMQQSILLANFKISLVSDEDIDTIFTIAIDMETGETVPFDSASLVSAQCHEITAAPDIDTPALERSFLAARQAAEVFAKSQATAAQADADQRLLRETARIEEYYKSVISDSTSRHRTEAKKLQRKRNRAASEATSEYRSVANLYDSAAKVLRMVKTTEELDNLIHETKTQLTKYGFYLGLDYDAKVRPLKTKLELIQQTESIVRPILSGFPVEQHESALQAEKEQKTAWLTKEVDNSDLSPEEQNTADQISSITEQYDAEKNQRIEELKDKFRIKMVISPISTALVSHPIADFRFDAVSGELSIPFKASHDLVTNKVNLPGCACCGNEMTTAYACSCGHLTCPDCMRSCIVCGKLLCSSCVKTSCQVCGGMLCESCISKCEACGKLICPTHSTTCAQCGKKVCKGNETTTCSRTCTVCGDDFCVLHSEHCPTCQSVVCSRSITKCSVCGRKGCPNDVAACASCGKPICSDHGQPCKLCGRLMCSECTGTVGCCSTCSDLFPAKHSIPAIEQLLAKSPYVRTGSHWLIGEGQDHFILAQRTIPVHVYVVEKSTARISHERRLGIIESIGTLIRTRR